MNGSGPTRRGLLAVTAATAVATPEAWAETPVNAAIPANDGQGVVRDIVLQVNGHERSLSIEPRVTLLDALRERLAMTGTNAVYHATGKRVGDLPIRIEGVLV